MQYNNEALLCKTLSATAWLLQTLAKQALQGLPG